MLAILRLLNGLPVDKAGLLAGIWPFIAQRLPVNTIEHDAK